MQRTHAIKKLRLRKTLMVGISIIEKLSRKTHRLPFPMSSLGLAHERHTRNETSR